MCNLDKTDKWKQGIIIKSNNDSLILNLFKNSVYSILGRFFSLLRTGLSLLVLGKFVGLVLLSLLAIFSVGSMYTMTVRTDVPL